MNLNDFNKLEHNSNNILINFIKELQNLVNNFIKNSNNLLENSICVVRDINDDKLSLVNIENGQELDIYAVDSAFRISELNSLGIYNNIFKMDKADLYNLNLGSNVIIKDGNCKPYYDDVKIQNPEAKAKLEDLYFCLEQEKDAIYSVEKISDEKIFLTNTVEGGYFSIPKAKYPDFKQGDLVKNVDGKYILI